MNTTIHKTSEAEGFIPAPDNNGKPITVIGTDAIRDNFDANCIQQALNSRGAPGVTDLVLNPDAHSGYGAPVGCVMVSPTHIYPGPVGVDIKCSMSLLQLDLPEDAIVDKRTRRALIEAIVERTPTGAGQGRFPSMPCPRSPSVWLCATPRRAPGPCVSPRARDVHVSAANLRRISVLFQRDRRPGALLQQTVAAMHPPMQVNRTNGSREKS